MNIRQITSQVSVSDQVTATDLPALAAQGVEILVCNRPDGEAADQPAFHTIKDHADKLGVTAVMIAFTSDTMTASHVEQLSALIRQGKRIHAYCRTGTRSEKLLEACATEANGSSRLQSAPEKSGTSDADRPSQARSAPCPHYDVVIVGAGSGGIAVAASLRKRNKKLRIVLLDPATEHYYQPGWTMVGGGVFDITSTRRPMKGLIPTDVSWIPKAVAGFDCANNLVRLADESEIHYDQLVVSAGLKLDWEAVEGLSDALGNYGVTSNYRSDLAPYTWQLVQKFKGGKALFTQPPMPIKCAGAPQKALYLSADHWRRHGILDKVDLHFYNSGAVLFGVKEYVPALEAYMKRYKAKLHFGNTLVKVDGPAKKAWFVYQNELGEQQLLETEFDFLHVCPPQCAPDFIRTSELADASGWMDVNPGTLQHTRFANVWGLGDVTNTTNAKTMAAVRKQAPVVAQNLYDSLKNIEPARQYDGYGSCPLTVERGKIVLAEFTYGGKLAPTFPTWINDGLRPTRFAWQLKTRALPAIYWHAMLKGREWLTGCKTDS